MNETLTPLISRVLIAIPLLALVLGAIYVGSWFLFGVAFAAGLLALHEYAGLVRPLRPLVLGAYLGFAAMLLGALLGGMEWLVGGFLLAILITFVLQGLAWTRQPATVAIGSTILGTAWIGFGLAFLLLLRETKEGLLVLVTVFLADAAANTFAYFGGKLLGRHRMTPVLSPAKTWEGLVTGTVAAVAVAFFALYEDRETFLTIWQALLLGAVVAGANALGDLFESALKRDMHVKDTGRLLGAHGGVLDRVDSLLFVAPASYFTLVALGHA